VGENGVETRMEICGDLENLGIVMDPERNNVRGKETEISDTNSKIKVLLIPTNEELMIGRDTKEIVG
ncbi:MAG: acetate kinase, partial [Anaerovoracaceae bacterium]